VTCPPNEDHWHGATPDQFMEHLALWEGDSTDTPETTWLEPVTDEQYSTPPARTEG
jgi:quercetin dioxygenase-like cupin family protein